MSVSLDELRQKSQDKSYAHFGIRCTLKKDWVWHYVTLPENITKHKFYPFISFEKDYTKYNSKTKKPKAKQRLLCYATHLDRCIYQYYAFILNQYYNKRVKEDDIDRVAVAYRTDLHKSNIHFAKEVFDFIRGQDSCYVMVGDFESFFDSLDHRYLKERLCDMIEEDHLPDDLYSVYKSITKYAESRIEDIAKFLGKTYSNKTYKTMNRYDRLMTVHQFHQFKKRVFKNNREKDEDKTAYHPAVKKNKNMYGIPQGSSISALFANVYMLDFDKRMHDYVQRYHGFYMRYCDDFIVVIPRIDKDLFLQNYQDIREMISSIPRLNLEKDKTQIYEYNNHSVIDRFLYISETKERRNKNRIDYLGFSFDGKKVRVRDKTLSKYYYRMYRKVKAAKYWSFKKKRIQTKSLYQLYSAHGNASKSAKEKEDIKKRGNFLTYIKRAEKEFGRDELIRQGTCRHMTKIKRAVDKWKKYPSVR